MHAMPSLDMQKPAMSPTSPTMRKRQRTVDHPGPADGHPPPAPGPQVGDDAFINDHDAAESGGDDDDDDDAKPKSDKKAGRRKIKIEFIQDKSRRHITFSKRKAGIMKKAYELSTLTGTQVLLLVVSETGLVYTFTTAKLQPLVTQPEGKNLIQACLNAPHGSLPSTMPVGPPLGRASGPMSIPGPQPSANIPGGLSISGGAAPSNVKDDDQDDDHHDDTAASHGGRPNSGDKRRRRNSSTSGPAPPNPNRGATSPHSPNATVPPPLNIPAGQAPGGQHPSHPPQSQIALGSPTSPQQQHQQVAASSPAQYSNPSYAHHPGQPQHHQPHDQMYPPHMMNTGYSYAAPGAQPPQGGPGGQQLGGLAAAAAASQQPHHAAWPNQQPQVGQSGGHYGRR
ncbi:Serum response factor-like protein A [Psilocybe cubensis]|uniref:MADS-box domain-containing protein n=2 Tax=Psilocybe cubensis TaxID=181762 RepID=A0A8H7XR13_PSICU|nr:Serum response factor-like protein A [Psilocybe cubensis]KAH9480653.1 Serum response factor-like protein A [Psilocybe cubensis]